VETYFSNISKDQYSFWNKTRKNTYNSARAIVKACKLTGVDTTYCEINSTYGHDAFPLEIEEEAHLIKHFLNKVSNGNKNGA